MHFHGTIRWSAETEVGQSCIYHAGGDTAGVLVLRHGASHHDLTIYEEGAACTLTARSEDGNLFRADGAECALNPDIGVSRLGVLRRRFDTFVLDLKGKTLSYSAHSTRRVDAQDREQCSEAHATLEDGDA